ncbi:MAG: hypothetical protein WD887_02550 [Candidatus Saccharimonadales bacterium]
MTEGRSETGNPETSLLAIPIAELRNPTVLKLFNIAYGEGQGRTGVDNLQRWLVPKRNSTGEPILIRGEYPVYEPRAFIRSVGGIAIEGKITSVVEWTTGAPWIQLIGLSEVETDEAYRYLFPSPNEPVFVPLGKFGGEIAVKH